MRRVVLCVAVGAMVVGCGGDDDQVCEELINDLAVAVSDCVLDCEGETCTSEDPTCAAQCRTTYRGADVTEIEFQNAALEASWNCTDVSLKSEDLADECRAELRQADCDIFKRGDVPSSCFGVIEKD